MDIDHDTLVAFAKTFGLLYLIALSVGVVDLRLLAVARQAVRPGGQERAGGRRRPMSVRERDPLTGHQTTGHEWNGITELNTRVPRAVWLFIIVTHVWALIVWILLPTWPLVVHLHQGPARHRPARDRRRRSSPRRSAARAAWADRIAAEPVEAIRDDAALMAVVQPDGAGALRRQLRGLPRDGRAGQAGLPEPRRRRLALGRGSRHDHGDASASASTPTHPETRVAQMLAFGRDGILSRDEVRSVVAYVQSLSGRRGPPRRGAAGGALRRQLRELPRRATARAWPSSAPRT